MGTFHSISCAFVWHSPAAVRALEQILRPSRPFVSFVNWREFSVSCPPDRDLLSVETGNILPDPNIVDAVNAMDVSALSAAFAREAQRDILEMYGDKDLATDDRSL